MRDRTFADFVVGALACISMFGFCAMLKESDLDGEQRRRDRERWTLPPARRAMRSPEDDCRHCNGSGACAECAPVPCRVCKGSGEQPHDRAVVTRLTALWNGAV